MKKIEWFVLAICIDTGIHFHFLQNNLRKLLSFTASKAELFVRAHRVRFYRTETLHYDEQYYLEGHP